MTGQQKYSPLSDFLGKQTTDRFAISITELEGIIGFPLPPSAKVHPAWWSNQNPPISQTKAWASVGWNAFPNLKTGAITFSRRDSSGGSKIAPPAQIREKLLL